VTYCYKPIFYFRVAKLPFQFAHSLNSEEQIIDERRATGDASAFLATVLPSESSLSFPSWTRRPLFDLGIGERSRHIFILLKTLPHFLRRCPKKSCAGSNNISSLSSIHFLMSSVVYAYTPSYHQSCMISKACFAVQHILVCFVRLDH